MRAGFLFEIFFKRKLVFENEIFFEKLCKSSDKEAVYEGAYHRSELDSLKHAKAKEGKGQSDAEKCA